MIAFLRGFLAARTMTGAIVEVGGVGYGVQMPASDIAKLGDIGDEVEVFTFLNVYQDGLALYGFLTQEEKDCFVQLTAVSGIGPKVALASLSFYSPAQLASAIEAQDVGRIAKIPGVGKKTAQRLILELKGKLDFESSLWNVPQDCAVQDVREENKRVREALLGMGFTEKEAELALQGAPEDMDEAGLVKFALKKLGSR